MKDSLIAGLFFYILAFFFVSVLLPGYLFTGTEIDEGKIYNEATDTIEDIDSGSVVSLVKITQFFKLFFAAPTVPNMPALVSWIITALNYTIIFMIAIYAYNKSRGIAGS